MAKIANLPFPHTIVVTPLERERGIVWSLDEEADQGYYGGTVSSPIIEGEDPMVAAFHLLAKYGIWAENITIARERTAIGYQTDKEGEATATRYIHLVAQVYSHHSAEGDTEVEGGVLHPLKMNDAHDRNSIDQACEQIVDQVLEIS